MRHALSIFIVLMMVLGSFGLAFAQVVVPGDVSGTTYQEAVTNLMEKGVVSGYPDGTYRPEGPITRAEASLIVVKSMNPSAAAIAGAAQSSFTDLAGYDWAKPYINYASANAVISGYPDGTFRPGDFVTYNEMATMLVRALGFQATDLPGVWPANFVNKAIVLGIFTGTDVEGSDPATRGTVALMTFRVVDDIRTANLPQPPATPEEPTYADLAGPLATYSGRAYGIILDVAKVLDADGDVVDQIEFLFGNKVLYLNTNEVDVASLPSQNQRTNGIIYGLQMRNGIVRAVGVSSDEFVGIGSPTGFDELTSGWDRIANTGDGVVQVDVWVSYLDNASIYLAVMEGNEADGYKIVEYKVGTARDIKVGSYVRMYSVTGDEPGVAEIVLIAPANPIVK